MDWVSITLSAISAASGALIGFFVGQLLGAIIRPAKSMIVTLLTMGGIVAGVAVLPPFISPYVTPYLSQYIAPTTPATLDESAKDPNQPTYSNAQLEEIIDQALDDLGDPFLVAVLTKEPSRAAALKARLSTAYRQGGKDRLVEVLNVADQQILASSFPYYMARATDQHLTDVVEQMVAILKQLERQDPETCHLWLFGASIGKNFDFNRFITAIGQEQHQQFQLLLADVVREAGDVVPDYDSIAAEDGLFAVGQELYQLMGDEKIGLVTSGQVPADETDNLIACKAAIDYFNLILARDDAADLLRHRFLTSL
ncbi:MAG: hypothetical protein ACWA5L_01915 [bacterium]